MTKDEALKLALEALGAYMSATDSEEDAKAHSLMAEAFFKIKEALAHPEQEPVAWEQFYPDIGKPKFVAQPEQEPVAWMNDSTPSGIFARHIDGARNFGCTIPLYTTPPQRKWVGLTDDEIYKIAVTLEGEHWKKIADAIQNKLKEKNI